MDKNLLKLYIFFLIFFFILIKIFPNLFSNINNDISLIKSNNIMLFEKKENNEVNIYENRGNVILMFDDGLKTQYTIAFDYMNKKKLRGSISVITDSVGEPDYINKSELYEMYNNNWDILNHTSNHIILNKSNINKQKKEIEKADKWLFNNNFHSQYNVLVYPEGRHNTDTYNIMKKLNYVSGRGIEDGFNENIPNDLYDIKIKNVITNVEPEEVFKWIDYAKENKLTLILLFHKLENNIDETNMKYNINNFYKIIDYINKKRKYVNVITYSDWINFIVYNKNNI